jgi:hypothetical protein
LWFGIRLGSRSWCTRRRWRQWCWRWWWRSRRDWTSMSIGIQTNRKIHLEIVLCFEITLAVGWDENYLVGLQRGLSLSNYNKSSHQNTEFQYRQLLHLVTICIWNAWIRCCNSYLLNEWLKLDFGQTVEVPIGEVKYVSAQAGGFLLSPL